MRPASSEEHKKHLNKEETMILTIHHATFGQLDFFLEKAR